MKYILIFLVFLTILIETTYIIKPEKYLWGNARILCKDFSLIAPRESFGKEGFRSREQWYEDCIETNLPILFTK